MMIYYFHKINNSTYITFNFFSIFCKKVLSSNNYYFTTDLLDSNPHAIILTFDDGLASQYAYIKELEKINTTKIFFISSEIVCPEDGYQDTLCISCVDSHNSAFAGHFHNYMKWSQIQHINETPNCSI
jgi:hypothetical protein